MSVQQTLHNYFGIKKDVLTPKRCESSPYSSREKSATPKRKRKLENYVLDAGQKRIGLQHCSICDMAYDIDSEEDRKEHDKFHNRFERLDVVKVSKNQLNSWKNNVRNISIDDGILFMFRRDGNQSILKKITQIFEAVIRPELGLCEDVNLWEDGRQVFMLIKEENKENIVIGASILDQISSATLKPDGKLFQGQFVGQKYLWIHKKYVENLSKETFFDWSIKYFYPTELKRSRLAFSDEFEDKTAIEYLNDKNSSRYIRYNE